MSKRTIAPVCADVEKFKEETGKHLKFREMYEIVGLLGIGGQGKVFCAVKKATKEKVALKRIESHPEDDIGAGIGIVAIREIMLQGRCNHPNVLGLRQFMQMGAVNVLELDLMPTTLQAKLDHLKDRGATTLGEKMSHHYTRQIVDGVAYLHSQHIMHRDLNPKNMLLSEDHSVLKLSDFGSARTPSVMVNTPARGTTIVHFRAIETLLGEATYGPKVDVWGAGVTLAMMLQMRLLFNGCTDWENLLLMFQIFGTPTEATWPGVTKLANYSEHFPRWGQNLELGQLDKDTPMVKACWMMLTPDPSQRPSAQWLARLLQRPEYSWPEAEPEAEPKAEPEAEPEEDVEGSVCSFCGRPVTPPSTPAA